MGRLCLSALASCRDRALAGGRKVTLMPVNLWRHYGRQEALVVKDTVTYGPGRVLAFKKAIIVSFRSISLFLNYTGEEALSTTDGFKVDIELEIMLQLEKKDKSIFRALHVFGKDGLTDPVKLKNKLGPDLKKLVTGVVKNTILMDLAKQIETRFSTVRLFSPINRRGYMVVGCKVRRAELTSQKHLDPDNPEHRRTLEALEGRG